MNNAMVQTEEAKATEGAKNWKIENPWLNVINIAI